MGSHLGLAMHLIEQEGLPVLVQGTTAQHGRTVMDGSCAVRLPLLCVGRDMCTCVKELQMQSSCRATALRTGTRQRSASEPQ